MMSLPTPPSPDSSDDEPEARRRETEQGPTDLRAMWEASRMVRARRLYAELMPLLLDAARDAQPGVRLRDDDIVREAATVLDVVAELLFSHGVYRCALVDGCLQVDFAPTSARAEFYNLAYTQ